MSRAHAVEGLAWSPEPDAAGRLAAAYAFETDTGVRRAIVVALGRRSEPVAAPVLALAASYDPDATLREIARGVGRARNQRRADGVAWLVVRGDAGDDAIRVLGSDGIAVPAVPDSDGALLVPVLSGGSARGSLAPFARRP